jgi:Putative adhesin
MTNFLAMKKILSTIFSTHIGSHRFWGMSLLLTLFILRGGLVIGQTTLQVVTKIVDKSFTCAAGAVFSLDAEKADLTFKTDAKTREVKLHIELIARHQKLESAKTDINALKLVTENMGGKIYIRNYVAIEKGAAKPTSDLRVRYVVTLPPDLIVVLKNTFGKLNIADLTNKLDITADYCKTQVANSKGQITLNTRFGSIEGDGLDGKIAITSHRTDIDLKLLRGGCAINAQFGKININAAPTLSFLSIKAEKSDVNFGPAEDAAKFGYTLTSEYGTVKTPAKLNFTYSEKSKQREQASFNNKSAVSVNIQTTFAQIVINQ